ncbi:dephospho-CoA kinase [Actinobaculum suis]|uniref:dephospho-CoA kinase n=1 Tax=Actinobaculum suis TaxID=1657 RepID=UPI0008086FBC|nr:dephospho-CoA kinase [Actinobaculum suis]OCA93734.1 dephospho-CoA kinase [Actinobaculum suis]OCA94027.1 dephospho-CoA kinase [Actinobaculum suis]
MSAKVFTAGPAHARKLRDIAHPAGRALRLGVTGGIGTGKSTVTQLLAQLHGNTIVADADAIAHELQAPGTPLSAELVATFGPEISGPGGEINRPQLAQIVFSNPQARHQLNAIMHPAIRRRAHEIMDSARPEQFVIFDVALLFEVGWQKDVDAVLLVTAPPAARITRLAGRGVAPAEARRRIKTQMSDTERRNDSHIEVNNAGTAVQLREVLAQCGPAWLWEDQNHPQSRPRLT